MGSGSISAPDRTFPSLDWKSNLTPFSVPSAHGQARSVVQGPCDEAALRYRDFVGGAIGHGHVRRAAVERIGPGNVVAPGTEQRPRIDALRRMQRVHGAQRGALE